ncbi:MAG: DUF3772 domain-containing protein [Paenirhodobacter sp.]|uniref:DUF3772 domain-containing protein n=1 Tax=Paenirhodobacter sp. TaxID=1965326 RepID=UPI003D11B67A
MIARFLRVFALALLLAVPAVAQDQKAPDYKSFESAATKVEQAVSDGTLSDSRLSEMRADMVKWRATFTDAQGTNGDQITTVKSQIAALGDPPAEGETEDPAIAKRRSDLNAQLAKLQAPGLTAGEAATRADSIIRNIDKLSRERQADKLLRLSPSPANPVNWPAAVSLVRWMGAWILDETRWRFTQPVNYDALRNNAPLIVVLVLLAGILMARGGRWMGRLTEWLLDKTAMRGRNLISGVVSLGQVALPVLGAVLLTTALEQTTLFGPILTQLFATAPAVLLTTLTAWWLGARVFPSRAGAASPLNLGDDGRAEGRVHAFTLGIALGLHQLVTVWIAPRAEDYLGGAAATAADKAEAVAERADAAMAVLQAPLQIFAALVLFRIGQLLRRHGGAASASDDDTAFRFKLMRLIGSAAIAIAAAVPVLSVIGYISAANALIWPALVTLALFAAIAVLQGFVAEFYVVVTRSDDDRREALVPVLAGFLLVLAAVPLFALIWGARVDDLLELWTSFRNGISVGGVRISPTSFITFAFVFGIGYTLTRLFQGALKSSILPKTTIDKGGQNAIISGLGYVGLFLAALIAISAAGIDLSSLAIVAGALSVGIGFGLQTIVQNFVSGIILLVERPISEGDWIEVGSQQGIVKAITVRSTRIETFDRAEVIVPNADLISGQVTNWTRSNKTGRLIVPVGVAYGSDTRRISKILLEIAEAQPLVMMSPEPFVHFVGFGADSLNFEIRAILSDVNFKLRVLTEVNHQINERFAAEGIEIPFAQRDIWLRNPETLRGVMTEPPLAPEETPAAPAPQPEPAAAAAPEPHSVGKPQPGEGVEDVQLSDNDGAEEGDAR